ncbi:MAG: hypothetical protein A3J95_00560 [Candidatus Komeilibacteria bacterium RIFOXYC2_FULL_45_12]|nr:MAG: hypothetical protein A3J95_00560 [Candidatus Komeilibacteria bacterium RIFOXYC2_FULL_45_12]
MPSEKSSGVSRKVGTPDNQQERLKTIGWIVGYVDGEGCFQVSIVRNQRTKFGWQVFPEFVVTQNEKSKKSLYFMKDYFKCGEVFINRRKDNHKENLYRYCVRSIRDLNEKIIPFFAINKLKTAKENDFIYFSKAIKMLVEQRHFKLKGIIRIAKIVQRMNRKIPSKFLESSETIRQIRPGRKDIVRTVRRRADPKKLRSPAAVGLTNNIKNILSEIPCRVSSDAHERSNDSATVSTKSSVKMQFR